MLTAYQTATANLLQNPAAPTTLYATTDLTTYINSARSQLAGDGMCIRALATFAITGASKHYAFSVASGLAASIAGILHLRMINMSGRTFPLNGWSWEYFQQYFLLDTTIATPTDWAQYGQGVTGSIYVNPMPDASYTLTADAVCYPIPLVNDSTTEAIPYPWTDAVPYFAAYLALMSAQTNARIADALRMLELYNEFKDRARRYSTPDVLPYQYEQSSKTPPVPAAGTKLAAAGGA
ncbi:MAG: hypothetical protein KGL39_17260 [Patescibacteria group bacterium]|nr:hypothetical protein [Patescibacteria group bacterium]